MKIRKFFTRVDEVHNQKGLFNISCYPEHCRSDLWRERYFLDKNYELIMHFASTTGMRVEQLSSKSKDVFVRWDYGDDKDTIKIIKISPYCPTSQIIIEVEDIDNELRWAEHEDDEDSTFAIKQNGLWGFIDYNAEIIIKPQYQDYSPFKNGLACVLKDSKWGFIDKNNNIVIDFKYDLPALKCFRGDFGYSAFYKHNEKLIAPIAKDNKYGVIDLEENVLIPFEYDYIFEIEKYICAIKDGKFGLIDINNNIILPFEYDDISLDCDNLPYYYVEKDGLYGLFDFEKDCLVVPIEKYKELSAYENVIIAKKKNDKHVLLDRKAFKEISPEYNSIRYVGENMFSVRLNKKSGYGFMTYKGEMITEMKYDFHCSDFKNGLCAVEYNNYKKGYDVINKKGEVLYHTPRFHEIFNLGNGSVLAENDNQEFEIIKLI